MGILWRPHAAVGKGARPCAVTRDGAPSPCHPCVSPCDTTASPIANAYAKLPTVETNVLYEYATAVLRLVAANLDVLLSVALGGVITFVVAWWFYMRAARQLSTEAARLRRLTVLMLRGMEETGLVRFSRDTSGEFSGLYRTQILSETLDMVGEISVTRGQPESPPSQEGTA